MEVGKNYFMIIDDVPLFGYFLGYCGSNNRLSQFEVSHRDRKYKVLLTSSEVKECVYA